MSNRAGAVPKIKDLGTLDADAECTEDFGIVDGLCTMCQQFGTFLDGRDGQHDHHASVWNLFWATKLGCRVCQLMMNQPLEFPREDAASSDPAPSLDASLSLWPRGPLMCIRSHGFWMVTLEMAVAQGLCYVSQYPTCESRGTDAIRR